MYSYLCVYVVLIYKKSFVEVVWCCLVYIFILFIRYSLRKSSSDVSWPNVWTTVILRSVMLFKVRYSRCYKIHRSIPIICIVFLCNDVHWKHFVFITLFLNACFTLLAQRNYYTFSFNTRFPISIYVIIKKYPYSQSIY